MNVCIIGAGYVGLTTAAVLAKLGHTVHCIDENEQKIAALQRGNVPIYEPGLAELLTDYQSRLFFHHNEQKHIQEADVIFICVGTPPDLKGKPDVSYVNRAIDMLIPHVSDHQTIVMKSTVPIGTNERIYDRLKNEGKHVRIVSNPEFLREGSAIYDSLHPDRIVIGLRDDDDRSLSVMQTLYAGIHAPYVVTSLSGAEMIKYAANAFLATKISFINEMARLCETYDVDVTDVATGIGLDGRIGSHFLQADIGYGGSCFPKDVTALIQMAYEQMVRPYMLEATKTINDTQLNWYIQKMKRTLGELSGKRIAVLGIAFKPNTDDIRESPAVSLIKKLHAHGADVIAHDPKAVVPNDVAVKQAKTIHEAIQQADALIVATDWDAYKQLNWEEVKQMMNGNAVIDGRNSLPREAIMNAGLHYIGVGRR
ncbi:UDP-glucose/GDP-mannose dehydrogenase family protein [Anoxybacillus flavithermus]|uniref:UDP-glucose 6-dehydrogenase n=1 Tax=Anoxybacillus flavithermus TaxID=33934 RepID=A0A2G5RSL4_9BACL|nr:UDP-glucose 6-dehydrogenase [Anoxybacillus sp. KU2-6(11)]PIC05818.1 UDP-glucose/GDP-mannose dehydrogenase family protein [Anoxybacillus flavithermus]